MINTENALERIETKLNSMNYACPQCHKLVKKLYFPQDIPRVTTRKNCIGEYILSHPIACIDCQKNNHNLYRHIFDEFSEDYSKEFDAWQRQIEEWEKYD